VTSYTSGSAFRRALEDRLRAHSMQTGTPLFRLRKLVTFDRFLARLIQSQPGSWIMKGGFAIQLRLVDKARTTKDIDLLTLVERSEVANLLNVAGNCDLKDWFRFEIEQNDSLTPEQFGGYRFQVSSFLDDRSFEEFHVDIGIGDALIDPIDYLEVPDYLGFAGIQPTIVPCYPITQQIAEKVHAYTRPHSSGESSRVKDFVDILLLAEFGQIDPERLYYAIQTTFDVRKTHLLPREIPDPPAAWARPYQRITAEVSLRFQTLSEGNLAIKTFLNPILSRMRVYQWDPKLWFWR